MHTVQLVATQAMIQRYFPDARNPAPGAKPGIMSAEFPIHRESCRTALGRWLGGVILSTRFDDDASKCTILLPATEQGLQFSELGERLMRKKEIVSTAEAERLFAEIEAWIGKQRSIAKVYGESTCDYRTYQFPWPVFGSAASGDAKTPEDYFDACAGQIRATGGVILQAGISGSEPPASIQRTMAPKNGGGDVLLKRYRSR